MTNNIAKEILQLYKYPVTLSFVQFGIVGFFCFLFGFFTQYTNTSSTTLLPSNSSHHFDKRNRRPSLWKVLTNNVDRLVSLSEPKNLKSIPPRLIGISSVRLALDCVFWGIQITVGYIMKFGRRLAKMIRFWLALGLGLHQTATDDSKVSTLPANSSYFHGTRIRLPSMEIVQTIFPLCLCLIFGHIFGSIALSNVTVSFVHTVKVRY